MEKYPILSRIENPQDVKDVDAASLPDLAAEIRDYIIEVVSTNGGHLASNLGAVELTIALHRVFESPADKIIWDVGHQCYTHKILTGRRDAFPTIRMKSGLSGFPKCSESEHDFIETGHASTSISAGLGLLVGQRLRGESGKVIAVIGDGSLTGGMCFEALNHAGHIGKDIIIVLNDNNMSISPNVGALSSISIQSALSMYLSRMTATKFYQDLRERIDRGIRRLPLFGLALFDLVVRLKKGIKAVSFKENVFSDLGFEYVGPIDGHCISHLTHVFENVRKLDKPVVVHVVTTKGRGYAHAEGDPTLYHGVSPFSIIDGKLERKEDLTFTESFSENLVEKAESDPGVVAITAAMADGTGLVRFRRRFPERFFDVGIAEQHALTFASGLAKSGLKPVVAVYSTFMQRAVDQVVHDIALPRLPVLMAIDRSGVVGNDGETHQGVFDIALFKSVPHLTILAPGSTVEMGLMLDFGLSLGTPVLLRYPKAGCLGRAGSGIEPLQPGRGVFVRRTGGTVLILSTGGLLKETLEAAALLLESGIEADVYNLRFIKPLDRRYLIEGMSEYEAVYTVEDGVISGGVGESIRAFATETGLGTRVRTLGVPDDFLSHAPRGELLHDLGLDADGLADRIRSDLSGTLHLYTPGTAESSRSMPRRASES